MPKKKTPKKTKPAQWFVKVEGGNQAGPFTAREAIAHLAKLPEQAERLVKREWSGHWVEDYKLAGKLYDDAEREERSEQ